MGFKVNLGIKITGFLDIIHHLVLQTT